MAGTCTQHSPDKVHLPSQKEMKRGWRGEFSCRDGGAGGEQSSMDLEKALEQEVPVGCCLGKGGLQQGGKAWGKGIESSFFLLPLSFFLLLSPFSLFSSSCSSFLFILFFFIFLFFFSSSFSSFFFFLPSFSSFQEVVQPHLPASLLTAGFGQPWSHGWSWALKRCSKQGWCFLPSCSKRNQGTGALEL